MKKWTTGTVLLLGIAVAGCAAPQTDSTKSASVITAKNNKEFAAIVNGPAEKGRVNKFAVQNLGKPIEFDGHVQSVYSADYDTDDAIVRAGTKKSPAGIRFHIGRPTASKDGKAIAALKKGQAVHISATVGGYTHDNSSDTFAKTSSLMVLSLGSPIVEVK